MLSYSPVAFTPDSKALAVVSEPEKEGKAHLCLWDVNSGQPLRDLGEHAGSSDGLVFSPDGKLLASREHEDKVRLWDVGSGRELPSLEVKESSLMMLFAPDSGVIVVAGSRTIRLHDPRTGKLLREMKADAPDGFRVRWSAKFYQAQQGLGWPVAFSPDGKVLAAAEGNRIRRWDLATGQEIDPSHEPRAGLFSGHVGRRQQSRDH